MLFLQNDSSTCVVVLNTATHVQHVCQDSATCSQGTYMCVYVCLFVLLSIQDSESPPSTCPGCEPGKAKSRLRPISDYYQETQHTQRTQHLTRQALLAPIICGKTFVFSTDLRTTISVKCQQRLILIMLGQKIVSV